MGVASVTPPEILGSPALGGSGVPYDLLFHFAGYAILTILLMRAELALPLAIVGSFVFGLGMEGIQFLLPFRDASALHAGVNLGGAIMGGLLAHVANTYVGNSARHSWW